MMENNKNSETKSERNALKHLGKQLLEKEQLKPIPFEEFLKLSQQKPLSIFRDVFQVFHDMVHFYVEEKKESKRNLFLEPYFKNYDFKKLLQDECSSPFFADRLFANRFMSLVNSFKDGTKNNQILLFEGPPGSGKSTFLNNLLFKMEEYVKTSEGSTYSTYWKLDVNKLESQNAAASVRDLLNSEEVQMGPYPNKDCLEFQCPSHDHPILMVPKKYRKDFLDTLLEDEQLKERLFNETQFHWIFNEMPCSICQSLFNLLLDKFHDPTLVYDMIYAKKVRFNRQFGEGISFFNPGDEMVKKPINNKVLGDKINDLIKSEHIKFCYSVLAKTNNGVFALMDIKEQNLKRLMQLHGVISDGIHKVGLVEERIKSLFIGLVNPEDKVHYAKIPSFTDRIKEVKIPYVLDYNIEVSIFKNQFGANLEALFLPGVLENFSKIIVSSRFSEKSKAIDQWLEDGKEYGSYTDPQFHLLKMELYTGQIPFWIKDQDIKSFDVKVKRALLRESEEDGINGVTGRESINMFRDFLSLYKKPNHLIMMSEVEDFFLKSKSAVLKKHVGKDFILSMKKIYDYSLLQEVKECIYYYNKEQISKDILNYLYALSFDEGDQLYNPYTDEKITLDKNFFGVLESVLFSDENMDPTSFRREVQTTYVSQTLAQEMRIEGREMQETTLFIKLLNKYKRSLKKNALMPFVENENFRRALLEFNRTSFEKYDLRLKESIKHLLKNLIHKYGYTQQGAIQVTIYLIDHKWHQELHQPGDPPIN